MSCFGDHCVTCSDEGVPMRVLRVDDERVLALCEDGDGTRATVEVALVEPVAPGDTLLVHAGVALVHLREDLDRPNAERLHQVAGPDAPRR